MMRVIIWTMTIIVSCLFVVMMFQPTTFILLMDHTAVAALAVGIIICTIVLIYAFDYRRGLNAWNSKARSKAIESLNDQGQLLQIALSERNLYVSWKAALRLTDQELIAQYILTTGRGSQDQINKITNGALLKEIASASNVGWLTRIAANERLPMKDVARVCCLASRSLEYQGYYWIESINGVNIFDYYGSGSFGEAGRDSNSRFITLLPGEWILGIQYSKYMSFEQNKISYKETTTFSSKAQLSVVLYTDAAEDYGIQCEIGTYKGSTFTANEGGDIIAPSKDSTLRLKTVMLTRK